MCQLSASENILCLGPNFRKTCGNLDSLFPGDSTGALFQGVSAVASHPVLDFGVQFPTGRSLPDPRDPAQPWDLFACSNTDAVKVC